MNAATQTYQDDSDGDDGDGNNGDGDDIENGDTLQDILTLSYHYNQYHSVPASDCPVKKSCHWKKSKLSDISSHQKLKSQLIAYLC